MNGPRAHWSVNALCRPGRKRWLMDTETLNDYLFADLVTR